MPPEGNYHDCNICGSKEYIVCFRGKDLFLDLPGKFQWVKCSTCGTLRQNPRLDWDVLNYYYTEEYGSYSLLLKENASIFKRIIKRLGQWKRVNVVQKYAPKGKWLDIGSGSGLILQEAKFRNRWSLFGLEPNKYAAELSAQALDLPIQNRPIEDIDFPMESFDIITLWDVLEHLPEPLNSIKKIANLLRTGGFLIFQTPNLDSFDREVFKSHWNGYDLPRHLYLFPKNVIRKMLEENGFKVLDQVCIAGTFDSYLLSLRFYNKTKNSKIISALINNRLITTLIKFLLYLPFQLIDKMQRGSHITYIVQKVNRIDQRIFSSIN